MKRIIATSPNNWAALVARLALGIAIFPHGAQKVLGWFGGSGISATMDFLMATNGAAFYHRCVSYPYRVSWIYIFNFGVSH